MLNCQYFNVSEICPSLTCALPLCCLAMPSSAKTKDTKDKDAPEAPLKKRSLLPPVAIVRSNKNY